MCGYCSEELIVLGAFLFRQALRLSIKSLSRISTGQILNLFSTELERFEIGGPFFCYLVIAPTNFIVVVLVLWTYVGLGLAALLGVGIAFIIVPLQFVSPSCTVRAFIDACLYRYRHT